MREELLVDMSIARRLATEKGEGSLLEEDLQGRLKREKMRWDDIGI